jgi:putative redox protein
MSNPFTFVDPVPQKGAVVVAEVSNVGYAQYLIDGRHKNLFADESPAVGGADKGPEPYELLLMALGSCTSITLRMYAQRHQWPLARVVVTLKHTRQYPPDSAHCETETRRIERIERTISLRGNLTKEQKQRLLDLADRCPVHQTLGSRVDVVTKLDESEPIP